jgi:galacturan 1,4-alpha-galacturonidase
MCIGSMGQDASKPDHIDNVVFENIHLTHSSNVAWIKTYPGNGQVKNVMFRNIEFTNVNQPIYITTRIYNQTNYYSSRIQISDMTWENIYGTARYNVGAGMHCSSSALCQNLKFSDINITQLNGDAVRYLCSNIADRKSPFAVVSTRNFCLFEQH